MNKTVSLIIAGLAFAVALPGFAQTAPTAPPGAPELFLKALTHPAERQLYAFDFVDQTGGDKPTLTRGRIDPSLPKGHRVTIYEAKGEDYNLKKAHERYERNSNGDIWCDTLAYGTQGPIAEKPAPAGLRIFSFTPLPKPNAKDYMRDTYKELNAEMTVDVATGLIKTFHAKLAKRFSPIVLSEVHKVELDGQCATAPNGRAYTAKLDTTIEGSAAIFSLNQSIKRVLSNLTPAGSGAH